MRMYIHIHGFYFHCMLGKHRHVKRALRGVVAAVLPPANRPVRQNKASNADSECPKQCRLNLGCELDVLIVSICHRNQKAGRV